MIKIKQNEKINPAFEKNIIPVCFAADNNYVCQTAIMIKSIIENSNDNFNYDLIVLSTDIDIINEKNILSMNDKNNVKIRIFNIIEITNDIKFFTDSVYTPTKYSKEAYFRLFIPYLMPKYNKVIYFDGDMVAIKDISPLYQINISKKILAATRDFSGNASCYDTSSDRRNYREKIGIKNIDNYFISSLVIFNIKEFNKRYSLNFIKNIISSRKWKQHDQDILNVLAQDNLLIIDAKWSYYEELEYAPRFLKEKYINELIEAGKDPCVIHYAGANKAWVDENSSLTKYFWYYAKNTPFFDIFNGKIPLNKTSYRYFIFKEIFNKKIDYYYKYDDIILCSTPYRIGKISDLNVCIEFMYIKENILYIDGFYENVDLLGNLKLLVKYNGQIIETYNSSFNREYGVKSKERKIKIFNVKIYLKNYNSRVDFVFTYDNVHFAKPNYVSVEQFAPINENKYSFYSSNGYIISKPNNNYIQIEKHNREKIYKLNKKLCKELKKRKNKYFIKIAKVRKLYYFMKPFFRNKNIWLITDRLSKVDNETISFYEYLKEKENIIPYFVVDKDFKDIKKLRKIGKVLIFKSKLHKFLFMYAKVIVSSTDNYRVFLPMFERSNEIRDLVANKIFVYWKKGKENLTYNIKTYYNTSLFVIKDKEEIKFLENYNNGYTNDNYALFEQKNDSNSEIYKKIMEIK